MEANVVSRECLQYSFCMFYQIYSLLLNDDSEAYLNLLLPALYYFVTYKNVQRFLFEKFPKFKQLMIKITDSLKKKIPSEILAQLPVKKEENAEEEKKEENEETKSFDSENFKEILQNHLLMTDKSLIGFIPLKKFFSENKKNYRIYTKDDQKILKMYLAFELLDRMECNVDTLEETPNDLLMKVQFETTLMEDFKNVH